MSRCQVGLIQWLDHKQINLLVLLITPILSCQQKLASFSTSTSPLTADSIQLEYCTFTESERVLKQCSTSSVCAKSRAFRNLGLWCDLWLGSSVCSKWSFIDLRSLSRGLGKIRHSERSQKNQTTGTVFQVSTDFQGKGVHFLQKPLTEPRNFKKIQLQKLPRSFWFFPVGEVWRPPQMNLPFFGALGCEIKGGSRDSLFYSDHHNFMTTFFSTKRYWTKMNRKHTPNQHAGECHGGCGIASLKGYHHTLPTSKPASTRRSWLACLVNQGQSPQSSRCRNFQETKDTDTTATTIETISNDNDTGNGCDWQY